MNRSVVVLYPSTRNTVSSPTTTPKGNDRMPAKLLTSSPPHSRTGGGRRRAAAKPRAPTGANASPRRITRGQLRRGRDSNPRAALAKPSSGTRLCDPTPRDRKRNWAGSLSPLVTVSRRESSGVGQRVGNDAGMVSQWPPPRQSRTRGPSGGAFRRPHAAGGVVWPSELRMRSDNRVVTKHGVPSQVVVHGRASAEADTSVARGVGETGRALA